MTVESRSSKINANLIKQFELKQQLDSACGNVSRLLATKNNLDISVKLINELIEGNSQIILLSLKIISDLKEINCLAQELSKLTDATFQQLSLCYQLYDS